MNPRCKEWLLYGGRGITVCDGWRDSFENFLTDMGSRPSVGHSLDRIDVNGNYEPGNCRWATDKEQRANQRMSAPRVAQVLSRFRALGDRSAISLIDAITLELFGRHLPKSNAQLQLVGERAEVRDLGRLAAPDVVDVLDKSQTNGTVFERAMVDRDHAKHES